MSRVVAFSVLRMVWRVSLSMETLICSVQKESPANQRPVWVARAYRDNRLREHTRLRRPLFPRFISLRLTPYSSLEARNSPAVLFD